VIVDANVLRNDIIYACEHDGVRTILVSAANAGFLRLFCASHVVAEVADHFAEWSEQEGVDARQFEAVWVMQYLPLLRMIAVMPEGLLSCDEERRVHRLTKEDPEDVPSVTLSLLLGGFYLSEDGAATTAVYGEARDQVELKRWREALAAGGNAGVLTTMLEASVLTARLARLGMVGLTTAVGKLPTWLQVLVAGVGTVGGIYLATNVDAERRQGTRDAAAKLLVLLAAVSEVHLNALAQFDHVRAPTATAQVLAKDRDASAVLTRAVLRQLSLSRHAHLSASEISQVLPRLPVSRGEAHVRAVLRSQTTATQVARGRWQLGEPARWPRTMSSTEQC
jgi:predicted nucleic acid-binding protein